MNYEENRELVEFLVDHDTVHKILRRKEDEKRRAWIRNRLRERRREAPQTTWEDCEAEFEENFPPELSFIEKIHNTFTSQLTHPELHGGKVCKTIWATMEDEEHSFLDFVEQHNLAHEEGQLFSYLARVMKIARMLHETTEMEDFKTIEERIRMKLSVIDDRLLDYFW